MFKKHNIIILFCIIQSVIVQGQDMHFTQFYASPLYLNPAFTGANVCSRASLVYRNQWPKVKSSYQSYLLSLDHFIVAKNIGIGLQCGVDQAGTGGLRTTIINPSIAYEAKLNRKTAMRIGVQPGVTIKSIQFDKLIFGDQISRGGNAGAGSVVTVESPTQSRAFFDIGAGALLYNSNLWIGTSFFHLNKPNESLYTNGGNVSILPIKYSVHGGWKIILDRDEKERLIKKTITLVSHYRAQAEFDQCDIGIYYTQYGVSGGLWYRGLPGVKKYKPGYKNDDAIAAVIGFQKKQLNIGYSYDFTISQLFRQTNGAHEITLSFQFCELKTKKPKRVLVSCPKF